MTVKVCGSPPTYALCASSEFTSATDSPSLSPLASPIIPLMGGDAHMDGNVSNGTSTDGLSNSKGGGDSPVDFRRFPVEDIVQHPLPGYVAPASIAWSLDDTIISYLFSPEGSLTRKLYAFDPVTRQQKLLITPPGGGVDEGNLSTAEKLRRERLRERGLGVTRYEWAKSGTMQRLLVPLPSGIYVQDGPGAELRLRAEASSGSPILDPQMAPDGSAVAYVCEDELWVVPASEGPKKQLTFGAEPGKMHGLAEYIAQEEMERRNGFWWSHDSRFIAYSEVDYSAIPPFRIMHQGKATLGPESEEDHPYPFAGQANVKVRLAVVSAQGGPPRWMALHCGLGGLAGVEEEYLARVTWMPDGSLVAQVQNRAQTRLQLLQFDPATGQRRVLLVEECPLWVNLHDCFMPLHKGCGQLAGAFIWASERTGFRHLYLYSGDGRCLGPLTRAEEGADWMVEQVAGVDEGRGIVYFTATLDSPLETHLYCTQLQLTDPPRPPRRLTQGRGRHLAVLDHQLQRFVDIYDSLEMPPRVTMCSLVDGLPIVLLYEQPSPNNRVRRLPLVPPEIVTVPSGDGVTMLYGAVYRPDPQVFGPPPYRTVVSVYGGPHVQTVCNTWMTTVDMRAQYLRSRGILVWKLDNRGSSRRGLRFEGAIKHCMGKVDVEDQECGVRWLIKEGLADPTRVGIYGWSYGGYLAAMALARCKLFKCAVAGAPVTSWDGYDTHYTERYMGTPQENATTFQLSAVMHHVPQLRGPLLLVHGMIDENVHFRHTARLINALTASAKEYDLLLFPDERHMPRGTRDRMYMEERIFEFLDQHLR
eukprot:TRINITY_DN4142_c0_g2_i1.p1 TRINITY_DN4142_c0_g2~~TRINITY_DN4142_c0_g2_i1.p1  ORF type:complete len:813 (+),score=98.81 TRINITY_DN4142_c0_g2_i1:618-3056(+)